MKIAFFSNFLNHHQLPLCQAFLKNLEVEFVFVATEAIHAERLKMGYEDMNTYPFVLRAYENEQSKEKAEQIAKTFDVVIFGASPVEYCELRMKEDKLAFRFCERSLKKGTYRRFIPRTRKKINREYIRFKDKNFFILCASAFTASDLALCGFPKEKCFRWGYFPKVEEYDVNSLLTQKGSEQVNLLYAGRLIKLKRVIDTLKALNILVKKGYTNLLYTILGDGDQKQKLIKYVKKHGLDKYVEFKPFVLANEVRTCMQKTNVYLFSSNFYEGWGAVVNEAMNSACAVVVSHAVGSSAYLIKQEQTGLVYKCASVSDLVKKLEKVVNDKEFCIEIGKNAYKQMHAEWNAQVAADRFLTLCKKLQEGKEQSLFNSGPCSPAGIIKNNWIKNI